MSAKDRPRVQRYIEWIEENGTTAAAVRLVQRRSQTQKARRKYRDAIEQLKTVVAQRDQARDEVEKVRRALDDLLADQSVEMDGSYTYESARRAEAYLEEAW